MSKVLIVAEIGCNHNGSISMAKEMVYKAKECGVDAVKFQTFKANKLVSKYAQMADYQKRNTFSNESQYEMISKLELTKSEYEEILRYSKELDIEIFSTAFDMDSIDFLYKLGQNIWKIPSGEITNLPYLEKIAKLNCNNKKIVLSTGMATMEEIKCAVKVLEQSKDTSFTVLHCNTDYPTVDKDMNLLALQDLKNSFPKWDIGLSDHSLGIVAPLISIGMGSTFIEKHFTLDKKMNGPDHKASITPEELQILCESVHRAEVMLGKNKKEVTGSEKKNKVIARKSIIAEKKIKKGEIFTEENICCKRPGNGISPMNWYNVIGRTAERNFEPDELIECSGIEWQ